MFEKAISEFKYTLNLLRNLQSDSNLGSGLQKASIFKLITKLLSHKVLRHYIYSMLVGRNATPYDARTFFESYYNAALDNEISDGTTVCPNYHPLTTRYHYNVTEKSLIEFMVKHEDRVGCSVLDIGSGAGRWIDFYLEVLRASSVTGVDIAPFSVKRLKEKCENKPNIQFHPTDKFERWDELMGNRSGLKLINKRIRSLRMWKKAVGEMGLRVTAIGRTKVVGYIYTRKQYRDAVARKSPAQTEIGVAFDPDFPFRG